MVIENRHRLTTVSDEEQFWIAYHRIKAKPARIFPFRQFQPYPFERKDIATIRRVA